MNILLALEENAEESLDELNEEERKLIARLADIQIERAQIELVRKILMATTYKVEIKK